MYIRRALVLGTIVLISGAFVLEKAVSQVDQAFESLPACDKLDVIANDGKSVREYILGSGYEDFDDDIRNNCTRHLTALNEVLVGLGLDPAFEALPPCGKLDAIANSGQSLTAYIYNSGVEDFEAAIFNDCRQYIPDLRFGGTDDVDSVFESLPPCDRLDVIASEGKSVPEYIAGSGYEDFDDDIRSSCTQHVAALDEALVSLGLDPAFEALPPCGKLDVISSTGQSVSEYIRASGVDDFATAIAQTCSQFMPDLNAAL